jgi:cell division protein FtsQ
MIGVVDITNLNIQKRIRKRKRRFKILLLIIILSTLAVFLLTVPVFKVNRIEVSGNNIVASDKIILLSGLKDGDNLLKLNIEKIEEDVLTNPYIETCKITRSLFGSVNIAVSERQNTGAALFNDKYVTMDKSGVVIEIKDNVEDLNLPLISGLNIVNAVPGKNIELKDDRQINVIKEIFDSITSSGFSGIINEVDINNLISIVLKTQYGVIIKLGSVDNVKTKLTVAKAIIEQDINPKGLKGTLDMSFNGNPVFKQE